MRGPFHSTARRGMRNASEVFPQIHPSVQAGNLIAIAIEHQSGTLEELAQATLLGLTPAGMVHVGIHVGVETVLLRRREPPGIFRLAASEADADNGLRALKAIFPGQDD